MIAAMTHQYHITLMKHDGTDGRHHSPWHEADRATTLAMIDAPHTPGYQWTVYCRLDPDSIEFEIIGDYDTLGQALEIFATGLEGVYVGPGSDETDGWIVTRTWKREPTFDTKVTDHQMQKVLLALSVHDELVEALQKARDTFAAAAHGDNCYLTDEPGSDQCLCGKESALNSIDAVLAKVGR